MKILTALLILFGACGLPLAQITSPLIAPVEPQTATLLWDYPPEELEGVTFNVYYTEDLGFPFFLLTNVFTQSLVLAIGDTELGFFRVKALRDGIESE